MEVILAFFGGLGIKLDYRIKICQHAIVNALYFFAVKCDAWILARFQSLSDKTQLYFGLNNFVWAWVFLAIHGICVSIYAIYLPVWSMVLTIATLVPVGVIVSLLILYAESICLRNTHSPSPNPLGNALLTFLMRNLTTIVVLSEAFFRTLEMIAGASSKEIVNNIFRILTPLTLNITLFFASCTPRPPQDETVYEATRA